MSPRRSRSRAIVAVAAAVLVASVVNPGWFGAAGAATASRLSVAFHLLGYAALAAALVGRLGDSRRGTLAAVALAVAVGAGIELLQLGLPYRTASAVDLAANAVGATVGATARLGWERIAAPSDAPR